LELLICGSPEPPNFKDLEKATQYKHYNPNDQVIQWFWQIIHNELSEEEQKKFLKFVMGTDRIPVQGLGGVRFFIQRASEDTENLPTSSTCYHVFYLPNYKTKAKLKSKMMTAINEAPEGFGQL